MRLHASLAYSSKTRSHIQRKSSITRSRLHLSRLRSLTLSAAVSESWIGIAVEWRKHDEVDIAFVYTNSLCQPGHVTHTVRIPESHVLPPSSLVGPVTYGADASNFICDHILDAVKYFQLSNNYKYHGAGLSEEVVRLSPQLPARLWMDLDIVPITTTCVEQDAWSTSSSGRSSVSMLSISSDESDSA